MPWPTLAKRPLLLPKGDWCHSCSCSPTPPPAPWLGPPWISPRAREHQCQYQLCSLNPRHHLPENPAASSLKRKADEYEWAVCMLGEGHAHHLRATQISGGTIETTRIKGRGRPQHTHRARVSSGLRQRHRNEHQKPSQLELAYIHYHAHSSHWGPAAQHRGLSSVLCDDREGGMRVAGQEGGPRGRGHIYTYS